MAGERRRDGHTEKCFEHQPDATINETNPGSGTKYEWSRDGTQANKLGTKKRVRIISIAVKCTWTVQPTPIEAHVTIDGQSFLASFTDPNTNTWYYVVNEPSSVNMVLTTTSPIHRSFLLEGRSVKVEAEITGGTVSNLSARVKYAVIP